MQRLMVYNRYKAQSGEIHAFRAIKRCIPLGFSYFAFSLTEILIAIGILAIGLTFILGLFTLGIHFNTIASEETIAAIIADEAFAKIRLFAEGNPADSNDDIVFNRLSINQLASFNSLVGINPVEFSYPSDPCMDIASKQFYWSALCRRTEQDPNSRLVQVTVFVCRKIGASTTYPGWAVNWPVPVSVGIISIVSPDTLQIDQPAFVNDGYTILDNQTGQIYRVLERDADIPDRIVLDRPWRGKILPALIWVVPPPIGGGRKPCIAVYQKIMFL